MNLNLNACIYAALVTVTMSMESRAMISHDFDALMGEVRRAALTSIYSATDADNLWIKSQFPFLKNSGGKNVLTFLNEAPCHKHEASDIAMLPIVGGENSLYAKHILGKARAKGLTNNLMPLAWHGGVSQLWVLSQDFKVSFYTYPEECEDESQFILTKYDGEKERSFEEWLDNVYLGHETL